MAFGELIECLGGAFYLDLLGGEQPTVVPQALAVQGGKFRLTPATFRDCKLQGINRRLEE
jgi:hypothetical protein